MGLMEWIRSKMKTGTSPTSEAENSRNSTV